MAQTRRVTSADGFQLAYDVTGSGPALVLLPGLLQSRRRWHDAGYVERLADRFTVITIDPLGHGDSDHPHDSSVYMGSRVVEHVVAVLDEERIESCVLWGFSRGAAIAWGVAGSVPERIELMILAGPPAHGGSFPSEMVDALIEGNWEPFLEATASMGEQELHVKMAAENDPLAIGAIFAARGEMQFARLEVPVVAYVGDGEVAHRLSRADAHRLGFALAVLPTGKHTETFLDVGPVMDFVSPFLPN